MFSLKTFIELYIYLQTSSMYVLEKKQSNQFLWLLHAPFACFNHFFPLYSFLKLVQANSDSLRNQIGFHLPKRAFFFFFFFFIFIIFFFFADLSFSFVSHLDYFHYSLEICFGIAFILRTFQSPNQSPSSFQCK